jgi:hypothetical protein
MHISDRLEKKLPSMNRVPPAPSSTNHEPHSGIIIQGGMSTIAMFIGALVGVVVAFCTGLLMGGEAANIKIASDCGQVVHGLTHHSWVKCASCEFITLFPALFDLGHCPRCMGKRINCFSALMVDGGTLSKDPTTGLVILKIDAGLILTGDRFGLQVRLEGDDGMVCLNLVPYPITDALRADPGNQIETPESQF